MSQILLNNTSEPSAPAENKVLVYTKSDKLYTKNSSGVEVEIASSGSQVVPVDKSPVANYYLTGYNATSGSFSSGSLIAPVGKTPVTNFYLTGYDVTSGSFSSGSLIQPVPLTAFTSKGDILVGAASGSTVRLAVGAKDGQALIVDSSQALGMGYVDMDTGFAVIIGDGQTAITAGSVWGYVPVPFAWEIESARVYAIAAGSIVVDVLKSTYADFSGSASGSSIVGASPITLAGDQKSEDTSLSGWSKSLVKGNILTIIVTSVDGALTLATVDVAGRKTAVT